MFQITYQQSRSSNNSNKNNKSYKPIQSIKIRRNATMIYLEWAQFSQEQSNT